jgi:hypothetical protein
VKNPSPRSRARAAAAVLTGLLTAAPALQALENSMLNLKLPSGLEPRQAQFVLAHRFYGPVNEEPLESFFGMAGGANVALGFRVCPYHRFEITASRQFWENENILGAGWAFEVPLLPAVGQIDAAFHSYKTFSSASLAYERREFFHARLDLSARPGTRFLPVVNLAFDTESDGWRAGFGANLTLTERFGLIGEIFPAPEGGGDAVFAAGLKVQTYGHHFLFQIGNSTEIGTHRLMRGTRSDDLTLGFGLHRLLDF